MISGILSIIMILLTYYGSYSGNFIAVVDSSERISSIVLSTSKDFEEAAPRLFADSISDSNPLVFDDMKVQEAVLSEGNYFDPDFKYFAYSFYIKNNGNQIRNVEARYIISEVNRGADEAIRVVIVRNDDVNNLSVDNLRMYKKMDKVPVNYNPNYPNTIDFEDDKSGLVFSEVLEEFKPGDITKYTVIIYVEGSDPDCTNEIQGGLIKMTFRFKIVEPEEN